MECAIQTSDNFKTSWEARVVSGRFDSDAVPPTHTYQGVQAFKLTPQSLFKIPLFHPECHLSAEGVPRLILIKHMDGLFLK
jgi:hypothetical protein